MSKPRKITPAVDAKQEKLVKPSASSPTANPKLTPAAAEKPAQGVPAVSLKVDPAPPGDASISGSPKRGWDRVRGWIRRA